MDKDCYNCEWDEICGWKFRNERGYCDKWKKEEVDCEVRMQHRKD